MASLMEFPTRIVHGKGAILELVPELKRASAVARTLVVTDSGVLKAGLLRWVVPPLSQAGLKAEVFADVPANPSEATALAALAAYRSLEADSIVALGGGSALDVARAVALLVNHEGPLSRYDAAKGGEGLVTARVPPLVSIPTSGGSGSEVSCSARILIEGTSVQLSSPALLSRCAILDADLGLGLPPMLTALAGLSALARNLEAFLSPANHPLADAVALEGLRRGAQSLKKAVVSGRDVEAREQLLLSAAFGSIAAGKGLGVAHALSYSLSAVLGLPHAMGLSLVLPASLAFNRAGAEERLAAAGAALGLTGGTAGERADALVQWADKLRQELSLPRKLSQAGVSRDKLPLVVEKALLDPCLATNPRPVRDVDLERILGDAF
jgi:alcohol dehydrogenase class IV